MAVQADGKILLAGLTTPRNTSSGTVSDLALVRYNPDGSLDAGFDRDGKLTVRFAAPVSLGNGVQSVALAVYPPTAPGGLAGKVLVAVVARDLVVARFNPDGSADASFGTGGTITFGTFRTSPCLAIQPDGKFVLAARESALTTAPPVLVARFEAGGVPDTSFGSGGVAKTYSFRTLDGLGLALQPDGKVVVGSRANPSSGGAVPVVVRFNPDGSPDATFGSTSGAAVVGSVPVVDTGVVGLALQSDGRVVLGTATQPGGLRDLVLVRLQGDAALTAAEPAPVSRSAPTISVADTEALLAEAVRRWAAAGADVSALVGMQVHVADLGGSTLGLATAGGLWLDDDAARWGWFVDSTPWDDAEFAAPGNQGEMNRMDLLSVLMHEVGHLLGHDHEEGGVMSETLAAGERLTLGGVYVDGRDVFLAPAGPDDTVGVASGRRNVR